MRFYLFMTKSLLGMIEVIELVFFYRKIGIYVIQIVGRLVVAVVTRFFEKKKNPRAKLNVSKNDTVGYHYNS